MNSPVNFLREIFLNTVVMIVIVFFLLSLLGLWGGCWSLFQLLMHTGEGRSSPEWVASSSTGLWKYLGFNILLKGTSAELWRHCLPATRTPKVYPHRDFNREPSTSQASPLQTDLPLPLFFITRYQSVAKNNYTDGKCTANKSRTMATIAIDMLAVCELLLLLA